LFAQHPVKEGEVRVADVNGAGDVDGGVEGELDALDQVEGDCVFEAAGPGQWVFAGGNGGGGGWYMSWKRMLERSSALEASERSMAESMVLVCCARIVQLPCVTVFVYERRHDWCGR
jgi:hypothetical protein